MPFVNHFGVRISVWTSYMEAPFSVPIISRMRWSRSRNPSTSISASTIFWASAKERRSRARFVELLGRIIWGRKVKWKSAQKTLGELIYTVGRTLICDVLFSFGSSGYQLGYTYLQYQPNGPWNMSKMPYKISRMRGRPTVYKGKECPPCHLRPSYDGAAAVASSVADPRRPPAATRSRSCRASSARAGSSR